MGCPIQRGHAFAQFVRSDITHGRHAGRAKGGLQGQRRRVARGQVKRDARPLAISPPMIAAAILPPPIKVIFSMA